MKRFIPTTRVFMASLQFLANCLTLDRSDSEYESKEHVPALKRFDNGSSDSDQDETQSDMELEGWIVSQCSKHQRWTGKKGMACSRERDKNRSTADVRKGKYK